jgi:hypothetical protein
MKNKTIKKIKRTLPVPFNKKVMKWHLENDHAGYRSKEGMIYETKHHIKRQVF